MTEATTNDSTASNPTPLLSSESAELDRLPSQDFVGSQAFARTISFPVAGLGEHVDIPSYSQVFDRKPSTSSVSTKVFQRTTFSRSTCSVDIETLNPFRESSKSDWEDDYNKCFLKPQPLSDNDGRQVDKLSATFSTTTVDHPTGNESPTEPFVSDLFGQSGMDRPNSTSEVSVPAGVPLTLEEAIHFRNKKRKYTINNAAEPEVKLYVDGFTEVDVLLGRGGRSNHHPGNKRYREEVGNRQQWYLKSEKSEKTSLAEDLVAFVQGYGGRFLKKDSNGRWYIVSPKVARRKASQALREFNTPEERAKKKAESSKEKDFVGNA